jgi:hypothetical protein
MLVYDLFEYRYGFQSAQEYFGDSSSLIGCEGMYLSLRGLA